MNVTFYIEQNELLTTELALEGKWTYPFFPRVGEKISPSLLVDWISPDVMYDALVEEEKKIWDNTLASEVKKGISEEESKSDNLFEYLVQVADFVSKIVWSKDRVLITLRKEEKQR